MGNVHAGGPADAWTTALDGAARRLATRDADLVLFQEEREDLRVDGDLRGTETSHSRTGGVAARLSAPSRSAFLSGARPEDLDDLVDAARRGAPPTVASSPGSMRPPCAEIDARRAGRIVRTLIAAALTERGGPEIVAVRAVFVATVQKIRIARPDRLGISDVRRGERIRIDVTVRAGERTARATGEQVVRPSRELRVERFARGVAIRAAARLAANPPPSGNCPAVFAPGVAGILVHELVGHALEADAVLRGASRLGGEKNLVAGPEVRIVDDPRRARVSWRVDDEGEIARPVSLVEGGRVSGLIHDRSSAATFDVKPTGHGRCSSFRDPILPRMGCTFLAAGSVDPEDAFEGVREGVLVRRMEAATVDPSTGHAVFRVTDADRIVQGREAGAVLPFLFAVETAAALHAIDALGSDLEFDTCVGSCARDGQPLAISVGAPTCRLGLIKVLG